MTQTFSRNLKNSINLLFLITSFLLTGCSMVRSWFPDKEKDYQFASEIAPLIIPTDLVTKIKTDGNRPPKPTLTQLTEAAQTKADKRSSLAEAESVVDKHDIQINLTQDTPPALQLNVPFARAWRVVGKAITRNNIEITRRSQENGEINIQLAAKTQTEHSFLDDTLAFFDPFESHESRYILKFNEINGATNVVLFDNNLKPITDGTDKKLLSTLQNSIRADLEK